MSSLRQVPNLPELVKKLGLKTFVETGCGDGDGLRYAHELGFESLWSCDLKRLHVEQCQELGTVYCSDSRPFLRFAVVPHVLSPTLFWLDAHFPEAYGVKGERWPLLDELVILADKKGIERDLVICDDMRVIQDPDNPTRNDNLPDYFKVNTTLEAIMTILPLKARIENIDTGILILEPK